MYIELVESLRCRRPHSLTWLVAATEQMRERDIIDGLLGCPTCQAEYPIVHGVADFTLGDAAPVVPLSASGDADDAMRIAALLDLAEPGGFVVLTGTQTRLAPPLSVVVDGVHLLAINAALPLASGGALSLAATAVTLPLRPGTARGVALDAAHAGPSFLASAVDALRPRGRLVAPTIAPLPPGVSELARDASVWVAERASAPDPIVPLGRRPRG